MDINIVRTKIGNESDYAEYSLHSCGQHICNFKVPYGSSIVTIMDLANNDLKKAISSRIASLLLEQKDINKRIDLLKGIYEPKNN